MVRHDVCVYLVSRSGHIHWAVNEDDLIRGRANIHIYIISHTEQWNYYLMCVKIEDHPSDHVRTTEVEINTNLG